MISDAILKYKSENILETNRTYLGDSQSAQNAAIGKPLSDPGDSQTGLKAPHQNHRR